MTTDFGTDLSSADDLDETRTVTGVELVAEDALWRLQTPNAAGILAADAPEYGLDLEELLGALDEDQAASLPQRIRSELTKDERILEVETTVTRTEKGPAVEYDIEIDCTTAEGPFSLVGKSDDKGLELAVKLLPGSA